MRFIGYEDWSSLESQTSATTRRYSTATRTNDLGRSMPSAMIASRIRGYRMALSDVVELYDDSERIYYTTVWASLYPVEQSQADTMHRNDHVSRTASTVGFSCSSGAWPVGAPSDHPNIKQQKSFQIMEYLMKKLFKNVANSVKATAANIKSSVVAFNRRAVCGNAGEDTSTPPSRC